ncbi:hypothetical protein Hypma_006794 [Hypsizygus marmoreus]|uniref:L-arabinokinase n=1 Tax=Hypsizygus marmoreus TaxID=39966 RepID=A0A369JWP0_HYPMA|nr:hypothetical protein Hypma_006794 [Hypsizygus marmoreus]
MPPLTFAYYCSGHGYGHATRVSAFASHLLSLPSEDRPTIYITSSAPKHVFAESIALGALYRYAEIDPIIVQPLAYRVDRQKSVDVLKSFLDRKDTILDLERQWLEDIKAHAVLSDAAFMGCLAAKAAGIPSILITNFTFDSVYSYLSTPLLDALSPTHHDHLSPTSGSHHNGCLDLVPDVPVPICELEPLVEHIFVGYRCADILFLLPGCIPIPSFFVQPSLPSQDWVDVCSNEFHSEVIECLLRKPSTCPLHPSIPFPTPSPPHAKRSIPRTAIQAPLIVRPPTSTTSVYTPEGRSRLLSSIGVPHDFHDPTRTKILIVSFGGQVFRTPSRPSSRRHSRSATPEMSPTHVNGIANAIPEMHLLPLVREPKISSPQASSSADHPLSHADSHEDIAPRLATPSHIWIPGAPPASKPSLTRHSSAEFRIPEVATIPPTPSGLIEAFDLNAGGDESELDTRLLPDSSWIAIVCGVSKDQWHGSHDKDTGLPDGFFVAPRDVYMPDLTAVGDVLLGKLGYGTVSECVDACTPFVYVSRPLFIEEHGLRLLLSREGVGVELSRYLYEAGDWASGVEEAWNRGKALKAKKRIDAANGIGMDKRKTEGLDMAQQVVRWTQDWWGSHLSN